MEFCLESSQLRWCPKDGSRKSSQTEHQNPYRRIVTSHYKWHLWKRPSNVRLHDGRTPLDPGTVVGHEIMGVIEEVGEAVESNQERRPGCRKLMFTGRARWICRARPLTYMRLRSTNMHPRIDARRS